MPDKKKRISIQLSEEEYQHFIRYHSLAKQLGKPCTEAGFLKSEFLAWVKVIEKVGPELIDATRFCLSDNIDLIANLLKSLPVRYPDNAMATEDITIA